MQEAWNLLRVEPIQRDRNYRSAILTYNVGDVVKAIVYQQYYGSAGVHAELEIALADTIAQIEILCLCCALDYEQLKDLGFKRMLDFCSKRMKNQRRLLEAQQP